jgi:DNA processing protein
MTTSSGYTHRAALAALTFIAEPADPVVGALLTTATPLRALEMLAAADIPDLGDQVADDAVRRTLGRFRDALREIPDRDQLDAWERTGIRIICPHDAEWPQQLDDLGHHRPYALWARGSADLRSACARALSVTGSRACTAYGSFVASDLASSAAARGWTVVSGGAYGVDAAAHTAALAVGGPTVAVLACGVDMAYPVGHQDLLDAIAGHGVIVSEQPPGRTPSRARFLLRNRIIAALSPATLVAETGERGGAAGTARCARDLGRTLLAVPGPITSEQSRGCHTMIRDWGATLVTGADDVLEALSQLPARQAQP